MNANRRCIVCDKVYNGCIKCNSNTNLDETSLDKLENYRRSNNISQEKMDELSKGYKIVCDTFEHYLLFLSIKEHMAGRKSKGSLMNDVTLLNISASEIAHFSDEIKKLLQNEPKEIVEENTDVKRKKKRKKYTQDSN